MAKARYRVHFYGEHAPGVLAFGVESFSRDRLVHECEIDLHDGSCFCTCESATLGGKNKARPSVIDEELEHRPCIHVRRVVQEAGWICAERERTAKRITQQLRRWAA